MAWELDRLDHAVNDIFGYHAVQLGLPELEALRANRMPHRWVACDSVAARLAWPEPVSAPPIDSLLSTLSAPESVGLLCDFDALPFASSSVDLVVLPHTLERARNPHQTLREVERVLVPDGRLVVAGFNQASLWGLRQRVGRLRGGSTYLPRAGEYIGYWRVRDWLRLLGFEIETGQFGCWAPPLKSQAWLERCGWIESLGDRWWPVLGAAYFLVAAKRVKGMHLVGMVKSERPKALHAAAPAVVVNTVVKKSAGGSNTSAGNRCTRALSAPLQPPS